MSASFGSYFANISFESTPTTTENDSSFVFSSIQPLSATALRETPSLSSTSVEVQQFSNLLESSSIMITEYFSSSQSIAISGTQASFSTFLPSPSVYAADTLPISAEIPSSSILFSNSMPRWVASVQSPYLQVSKGYSTNNFV